MIFRMGNCENMPYRHQCARLWKSQQSAKSLHPSKNVPAASVERERFSTEVELMSVSLRTLFPSSAISTRRACRVTRTVCHFWSSRPKPVNQTRTRNNKKFLKGKVLQDFLFFLWGQQTLPGLLGSLTFFYFREDSRGKRVTAKSLTRLTPCPRSRWLHGHADRMKKKEANLMTLSL